MILTRGVLEAMQHQLRAELPNECCGVLSGRHGAATTIHRATNRNHSPDSFRITLLERLRIFWRIYWMSEEVVAIYHSHPRGTLALSEPDRRATARSGIPSIIVTPDGALAAYTRDGRRVDVDLIA